MRALQRNAERLLKDTGAEVFVDARGRHYLSHRHPVRGGLETVELGSDEAKHFVTDYLLLNRGSRPNRGDVDTIIQTLAAVIRRGDAPRQRAVHLRVAHEGGAIYLDLADTRRGVARVTADGWEVTQDCPVAFLRKEGMLALPEPVRGGRLEELLAVFPPSLTPQQRDAVAGWLFAAFHPGIACHILYLWGRQGSGKTVLIRRLRALLDPSEAGIGGGTQSADDQAIAAINSHLQVKDNLSRLNDKELDAICRTATGDSHRKRKNYSDLGEVMASYRRPVILAGVRNFLSRGDVLDRCVPVEVSRIADAGRASEADLDRRFEQERPRLLGVILDALSAGLRTPPPVKVAGASRMADAAIWGEQCFRGLGLPVGRFSSALRSLRAEVATDPVQSWAPLPFLLNMIHRETTFTASQLLLALDQAAAGSPARDDVSWPKRPEALGSALRDYSEELRAEGIAVSFYKSNDTRKIVLAPILPSQAILDTVAA